MRGLSRGSRTTLASCAWAVTLNVPRLHSTRAVPTANAAVIILMPWPPCHTAWTQRGHPPTFDVAPPLAGISDIKGIRSAMTFCTARSLFGLKIASDSIDATHGERRWACRNLGVCHEYRDA